MMITEKQAIDKQCKIHLFTSEGVCDVCGYSGEPKEGDCRHTTLEEIFSQKNKKGGQENV